MAAEISFAILEDRMAELAARIAEDDEREMRYASMWLDKLWSLREAALAAQAERGVE